MNSSKPVGTLKNHRITAVHLLPGYQPQHVPLLHLQCVQASSLMSA